MSNVSRQSIFRDFRTNRSRTLFRYPHFHYLAVFLFIYSSLLVCSREKPAEPPENFRSLFIIIIVRCVIVFTCVSCSTRLHGVETHRSSMRDSQRCGTAINYSHGDEILVDAYSVRIVADLPFSPDSVRPLLVARRTCVLRRHPPVGQLFQYTCTSSYVGGHCNARDNCRGNRAEY